MISPHFPLKSYSDRLAAMTAAIEDLAGSIGGSHPQIDACPNFPMQSTRPLPEYGPDAERSHDAIVLAASR